MFADLSRFRAINPVVRAPTVFLDDGTMLMESSVIIEYFERTAAERSLWPREEPARSRCAAVLGLALTACDKAAQLVYERELRPAEKRFSDWANRVAGQVQAACELLEQRIETTTLWLKKDRLTQAGLTLAVVCTFMQHRLPDAWPPGAFPGLRSFCDEAEALAVFRRWPHAMPQAPIAAAPLWT